MCGLGDVIAILDSAGNIVVEYRYDAWGATLAKTGSMAGTLGVHNPFRYRGYVFDLDTGLYYLKSRYYNPKWGRFINADVVLGQTGEVLSHNLFAYCRNCSIIRFDPNGLFDYYVHINVYLPNDGIYKDGKWQLGHVDITVFDSPNKNLTYTYGRYDDKATRGFMKARGDGVFIFGWEDKFHNEGDHFVYKLSMTEEEYWRLNDFYWDIVRDNGVRWTEKCTSDKQYYKFNGGKYEEYFLLKTNCTTFALDALEYAFGEKLEVSFLGRRVPYFLKQDLDKMESLR